LSRLNDNELFFFSPFPFLKSRIGRTMFPTQLGRCVSSFLSKKYSFLEVNLPSGSYQIPSFFFFLPPLDFPEESVVVGELSVSHFFPWSCTNRRRVPPPPFLSFQSYSPRCLPCDPPPSSPFFFSPRQEQGGKQLLFSLSPLSQRQDVDQFFPTTPAFSISLCNDFFCFPPFSLPPPERKPRPGKVLLVFFPFFFLEWPYRFFPLVDDETDLEFPLFLSPLLEKGPFSPFPLHSNPVHAKPHTSDLFGFSFFFLPVIGDAVKNTFPFFFFFLRMATWKISFRVFPLPNLIRKIWIFFPSLSLRSV